VVYLTWWYGENLLWSAAPIGPGAVVGRWLASPPHREELLDPRFRELGISALRALAAPGIFGGQAVVLIVADFGVRPRAL